MTDIGRVGQIWRYPAKSMQGERLGATEVTSAGVVGDRGWAVRDEERGGIRGAKKIGALMNLTARYLDQPAPDGPIPTIEIGLPDGSTTTSDAPDVNQRLSGALERQVTLWPLQPSTDLDHYRRGAPDSDDLLVELRDIFGRELDEPLPDLTGFPPEIFEFESPPGTYLDAFALHLLTDRSLASLQARLPDSAIDVRRFRPNLVIELDDGDDDDPWPELAWVGKTVSLGALTLDIVAPCPRCVMPTRAFADLDADRAVLRTIVAEADQNLGVYATVRKPGTVSADDRCLLED